MRKFTGLYFLFSLVVWNATAQEPTELTVFENQPINFGGEKGDTLEVRRYQDGRLIFKKVEAPSFVKGTDVEIELRLKSAGDAWDKSGSVFVLPISETVTIEDVAKGIGSYPQNAGQEGYPGIKASDNYTPPLEVLRFMTPFGVGFYSKDSLLPNIRRRRPLYIPKWEEEVVWKQDVSQLENELTGDFIVGVWIDTWTAEGYEIDLSFNYTARPLNNPEVLPLVNTVYYAGQKLPDLFAYGDLEVDFKLEEPANNAKLYYITTGHGGHRGGDEFIKINNNLSFDGVEVLDIRPWRDDCASFRRFNPHSGVWKRRDTLQLPNKVGKIEDHVRQEEVASSDLSRSNWCPGSMVKPLVIDLGDLKKGNHHLRISIDGTPIEGDKLNHWLVSTYLVYD